MFPTTLINAAMRGNSSLPQMLADGLSRSHAPSCPIAWIVGDGLLSDVEPRAPGENRGQTGRFLIFCCADCMRLPLLRLLAYIQQHADAGQHHKQA